MLGPLTTEARVRQIGGLDDANAYLEFRLASDAALSARILTEITAASAWLQSRAGNNYATGNTVIDTMFGEAEAYLTLQGLYQTLKMRKVRGSHFPLMTEDSQRFESLTDVEMPAHITKFIDAYMVVEPEGKPWAAPAMAISGPIKYTQPQTETERQQLDDLIDQVNGLPVPVFPLTTEGTN